MLEVADIVRLHGPAYRQQFGRNLTLEQKRALHDIEHCRTPFFGGHVYQCDHCSQSVFSYHSCGNRSCPKCHQNQTQQWLEKQREHLLPCSYFLVTFTLPEQLRPLARYHPRKIYGILMKAAAAALQKLAADPRYLGARLGLLAVLHTWTRAMLFHPHVHMLVTAGGLAADGSWVNPKHPRFLVPVGALSIIFRAKICAALKKSGLLDGLPQQLWKNNWVVHCQHAGRGEKVLLYLARYVFRIAIANSRIESVDELGVRFRYRDNKTHQLRHVSLSGVEFISRFLQHVLPQGCVKVRYYGLFAPSRRQQLEQVRRLLAQPLAPVVGASSPQQASSIDLARAPSALTSCPHCRIGRLMFIKPIPPQRSHSP